MSTLTSEVTSAYATDGWCLVRGLLRPSEASALLERLLGVAPDRAPRTPLERELYGDPVFDGLLPRLGATIAEVASIEAVPTYSFARLYPRGRNLALHRDRPACEHSISLHLGASEPVDWPLWIRDHHGQRNPADLQPGDAVLYQGIELRHWRASCPVDWYAQAFFHFIDGRGPHAAEKFDHRPALGLPADTKS